MQKISHIVLPLLFIFVTSQAPEEVTPPIDPSELEEKLVEYGDSNGVILQGLLVYPKYALEGTKDTPAVIVFHSYNGRTDFEDLKARDLALDGYVAFAADLYGKGVAGNDTIDNIRLVNKLLDERNTTLEERVLAAWKTVKELEFVSDVAIACIGYSFGGLACLDLARFKVGLSAAVSFHGMFTSYPGNNSVISTSIQVHHGIDDPNTDWEEVDDFILEMKERQVDWQFILYANAVDGFTTPGVEKWGLAGAAYNEKADLRSNIAMEIFLAEKLLDFPL